MAIKSNRNNGKGGPLTTKKKKEIENFLLPKIKTNEIAKLNYETIAKDFNTTRQTISKLVDKIYSEIPPEEIQRVMVDFKFTFERLEDEVNQALQEAATVKEKTEVIKTYFMLIREKTDYLEKFFIKPKAQENINLHADITQKQIVINYNVENGTTHN